MQQSTVHALKCKACAETIAARTGMVIRPEQVESGRLAVQADIISESERVGEISYWERISGKHTITAHKIGSADNNGAVGKRVGTG